MGNINTRNRRAGRALTTVSGRRPTKPDTPKRNVRSHPVHLRLVKQRYDRPTIWPLANLVIDSLLVRRSEVGRHHRALVCEVQRLNPDRCNDCGSCSVSVTIDDVMTNKLSHDPAHWHDRADDARRVAAEILDPVSRRKKLEIAEGYDGLARRGQSDSASALKPILLQKSFGLDECIFSGPWRGSSKKHVAIHSIDCSCHQGLPHQRGDAREQRFLLTPALASIFSASNFSTLQQNQAWSGYVPGRSSGR
jgi:hypothetical protein